MRLSELARSSGVSVATIKYYLRERLLPAGEEVSRTQASYGTQHLERLRLIRSLREVADLPVAAIGRVLAAIDDPAVALLDLLGVAQRAVTGIAERAACADPGGSRSAEDSPRARALVAELGWDVEKSASPVLVALDRVLAAIDSFGDATDAATLGPWIGAAQQVAEAEVATVPIDRGRAAAAQQVAVGTVLYGELFSQLRSLAQEKTARRLLGARTSSTATPSAAELRTGQRKTVRRPDQPKTERRSSSSR